MANSAENIIAGLEDRSLQQKVLQKYFESKTQLAKNLLSTGLDKLLDSRVETPAITQLVANTVKDNVKPVKKVADQSEEELLALHRNQVEIAMGKLSKKAADYAESNPRLLLSLTDETHAEEERMKLEKFMSDMKLMSPLKDEHIEEEDI